MIKKSVDYLNGKLFPMILKFSIPAAVSLLITAVYNIVDRMFVGNFNGTSALASWENAAARLPSASMPWCQASWRLWLCQPAVSVKGFSLSSEITTVRETTNVSWQHYIRRPCSPFPSLVLFGLQCCFSQDKFWRRLAGREKCSKSVLPACVLTSASRQFWDLSCWQRFYLCILSGKRKDTWWLLKGSRT